MNKRSFVQRRSRHGSAFRSFSGPGEGSRTLSIDAGANLNRKQIETGEAPYEMDLQFDPSSNQSFGLRIYTDEQHWTEIGFDRGKKELYMDRTKSGAEVALDFPTRTTAPLVEARLLDLKLVVDRSSVEAFAQGGTIAMTNLIYPPTGKGKVEIFSATGKGVAVKGHLWKLGSIWR